MVDWVTIGRQQYEDMVSILLSLIYPRAQRIDGSGGDGGRDVQIRDADGFRAFELKSFTGRMGKVQRPQVIASLEKAAKLKPNSWTLVVPIDPTPGEDEWFEALRTKYDFPLEWLGRTWLDGQMSCYPQIERYYLRNSAAEVVQILKEITREEAHIGDVFSAAVRTKVISERLNEIDPQFRYSITTLAARGAALPPGCVMSTTLDDIRIDMFERYRGALHDRPITVNLQLQSEIGDVRIRDVERAFDLGLSVSIPSELVKLIRMNVPEALGGTIEAAGGVEITGSSRHLAMDGPELVLYIDVFEGERHIITLPFTSAAHDRTWGLRGGSLIAYDASRWLKVQVEFHIATKKLQAAFTVEPCAAMPSTLIPLVDWLAECTASREFRVRIGDDLVGRCSVPDWLRAEDLREPMAALWRVQRATGTYFAVSPDLTEDDWQCVADVDRLLAGDIITYRWGGLDLCITIHESTDFRGLDSDDGVAVRIVQDESVTIGSQEVRLGSITTELMSARVEGLSDILTDQKVGDELTLHLVPGRDDQMRRFASSQHSRR